MTNLTECDYVSKETTQYIREHICQKFIDTWDNLAGEKIPHEHIKRGLALVMAYSTSYFTVTQNIGPEIREIINDVQKVLEESRKKGVHFAAQSAALEILIPVILGIDYRFADKSEMRKTI